MKDCMNFRIKKILQVLVGVTRACHAYDGGRGMGLDKDKEFQNN